MAREQEGRERTQDPDEWEIDAAMAMEADRARRRRLVYKVTREDGSLVGLVAACDPLDAKGEAARIYGETFGPLSVTWLYAMGEDLSEAEQPVVEAEQPVVEGAADLQALAAQIEARREAERRLDEDLDAAFAALVEPEEMCHARRYAEAVAAAERDFSCEHGHGGCAAYRNGGACMDELLSTCGCADCREAK